MAAMAATEEEPQGPHALTGAAAAEEEAGARERLMFRPSERRGSSPRGTRRPSWLRNLVETYAPVMASVLFQHGPGSQSDSSATPSALDAQLAVVPAVSEDECSICLATLGECVTTPCGHSFHAACLEHYFKISRSPGQRARCPLCRASVHTPAPVEVRSTNNLPIEAVAVPAPGGRCHYDRPYFFMHLGGFDAPNMIYLMSSNEDRKTPAHRPMWVVELAQPCSVHLNFRSERHVSEGHAEGWLAAKGFVRNPSLRSTRSSGVPNGPYVGPVFSKACDAGTLELMGSATWEGTYFVFVELAA